MSYWYCKRRFDQNGFVCVLSTVYLIHIKLNNRKPVQNPPQVLRVPAHVPESNVCFGKAMFMIYSSRDGEVLVRQIQFCWLIFQRSWFISF